MVNEEYLLVLDYENMSIKALNEAYTIIGSFSSSLCDNDIRMIILRYRQITKKEFPYKKMLDQSPPKIMKKAPR